MSWEATEHSLRLFANDVAPEFRRLSALQTSQGV
jgi:hypothetical protein